jgi:hypothetical protein
MAYMLWFGRSGVTKRNEHNKARSERGKVLSINMSWSERSFILQYLTHSRIRSVSSVSLLLRRIYAALVCPPKGTIFGVSGNIENMHCLARGQLPVYFELSTYC